MGSRLPSRVIEGLPAVARAANLRMGTANVVDKGQMLRFGVDEDRRDSAIADIGNDETSPYVKEDHRVSRCPKER